MATELDLRSVAIKNPNNQESIRAWEQAAFELDLGERQQAAARVILSTVGDSALYRKAITLFAPTYTDVRARLG